MIMVFLAGWLRINVDLAIFQPYLNLEAGDNQSLKIQVAMVFLMKRKEQAVQYLPGTCLF